MEEIIILNMYLEMAVKPNYSNHLSRNIIAFWLFCIFIGTSLNFHHWKTINKTINVYFSIDQSNINSNIEEEEEEEELNETHTEEEEEEEAKYLVVQFDNEKDESIPLELKYLVIQSDNDRGQVQEAFRPKAEWNIHWMET